MRTSMRPLRGPVALLVVALVLSGCSGIRVRSNVVGAAVKIDGENAVIAVVPGEVNLPPDKAHVLTFSAPGFEDGKATVTPRCSHGLAVLMIVGDILTTPAIIGIANLIAHSIRIASDPVYPGVYDEEEVFVDLKPQAGAPNRAPVSGDANKAATSAPAPAPERKREAPTPAREEKPDQVQPAAATTKPATRFCGSCGSKVGKGLRFCRECGAKQ